MTKKFLLPLSVQEQTDLAVGRPAPYAFADKVRFAELDALNHVNNVAYQVWFETIRVQYFNAWGLSNYLHDGTEPRIVIRRSETDYLREMRQDDEYVVTCRTTTFRKNSFTLINEIWCRGDCTAIYRGIVVLLDPNTNKKTPIPQGFKARILSTDGAKFVAVQEKK